MIFCVSFFNKGIFVIRMGAKVKEKLNMNNSKIIDYATNGMRNEFMDIYLGSKCFFWLSTGSGLDSLNQVFRKPIIYTNCSPIGFTIKTKKDALTIYKHHFDNKTKKRLSIKEIMEKNLQYADSVQKYSNENIDLIENTPLEISDAVEEMYNRLTFTWKEDKEGENLQDLFWKNLFSNDKSKEKIVSRIGSNFLKENKYLLTT